MAWVSSVVVAGRENGTVLFSRLIDFSLALFGRDLSADLINISSLFV